MGSKKVRTALKEKDKQKRCRDVSRETSRHSVFGQCEMCFP